jgi:lipopolysaccharide/colanic/teichoic acid biosynthesis glycosyltransferase
LTQKAGRRIQEITKRAFDICFATLASLLLLPIAVLATLAIWLTSGRLILHRAVRVGRHGRSFLLYKFRTMVVNAHASGPGVTRRSDPRITAVGRMLRKTKFGEFP